MKAELLVVKTVAYMVEKTAAPTAFVMVGGKAAMMDESTEYLKDFLTVVAMVASMGEKLVVWKVMLLVVWKAE